jgi:fibronectin-binding autotransporter adhesin
VVLKYTTFSGNANFAFGSVPSAKTGGYISNNTSINAIVMVLTNGPQTLTWTAAANGDWDTTSINWNGFTGPTAFSPADSVLFNDAAPIKTINLAEVVQPNLMTFNDNSDYTITGTNSIGGFGSLTKTGTGTLTLSDTGVDAFNGGVTVNGGAVVFATDTGASGGMTVASGAMVQMGTNGPSGTLPSGGIANNGAVLFDNSTNITYSDVISGNGALTNISSGRITLSGANTFTGAVAVASGTLRTSNGSALGVTNNGTFVSSGATLDVNNQDLGAEPITVSGTGVGGAGAIINSGSGTTRSIRNLTLLGPTTLGGTGRWDLRSSDDTLTDANLVGAVNITKIGTNQISFVGVNVDGGLGTIDVQQGMFSVELGTTGLGDSGSTLTVASGATLQLYNSTVELDKQYVLHGDGVTTTLNVGSGTANKIGGALALSGNVIFSAASGATLGLNNGITVSGTANLLKTGAGTNTLAGSIGYVGTTTVTNGTLNIDGSKNGGTGITVAAGAGFGGSGYITEDANVSGQLTPGDAANGQAFNALNLSGNLTLNNNTNLFRLQATSLGGSANVSGLNNFTVNGTCYIQVAVLGITPLTAGDTYTLFSFSGTSNADTNNLQVLPLNGYTFHLETNSSSVQLVVDTAIKDLKWVGDTGGGIWDIDTTANWLQGPGFSARNSFTNGDFVTFDDTGNNKVAGSNVVNISTTVAPGVMKFNNTVNDPYLLQGSGSLTGSGGMVLGSINAGASQGTVIINNTGSNDFTGDIDLESGTLQVGVGGGGATLSLGTGKLYATNYPSLFLLSPLVLNRSDSSLMVSNAISGSITISNIGLGTVTLAGNNSMTGGVYVVNGTLAAGAANALGTGPGVVVTNFGSGLVLFNPTNSFAFVFTNATLDVGGQNLGTAPVEVIGGGATGQGGVIVNNSTNAQTQALRFVTLAGDVTFGGKSRWDIRGEPAGLLTDPPGSPYNITKIGTNQVSLVAVTNIDTAISNIDIQAGIFAIQTTTINIGDPNGTITVHTNAVLDVYNLSTPVNKLIVVQDGGTVSNENTVSVIMGDMFLNGTANLSANSGTTLSLSNNIIHGSPTSIFKGGSGTLQLINNTLPTSSLVLFTLRGTLDLSQANGANSGALLALSSGQTLKGNGTILSNLTVGSGATLQVAGTPTTNASDLVVGTLDIANTLTLNSSATLNMTIGKTNSVGTNDMVAATNIVYNGILNVSLNANSTVALAAGDSFPLFQAVGSSGSFSQTNLPDLNTGVTGLYWATNGSGQALVNGTITVASAVVAPPPSPSIGGINVSGGSVVISGTNNNGTAPGTYHVLTSTNVTVPLTNWTVLTNGSFDANGNFSSTNAPSGGQRFYILQVP